ncbi:MAG: hypothetical protein GX298_03970, partial [Planctomycetes bacterium]|nr:hypothetical protein [Planctomycetota bacterium]
MAKSTRVYILAKELGVKSQAIVEKCQAEGLKDIKNHMAVISVGLAATIREWFSEGEHTTAVEKAAPVDLKKVRVKRKKKVEAEETPQPTETDQCPASEQGAAVAEATVQETETSIEPGRETEAVAAQQAAEPTIEVA